MRHRHRVQEQMDNPRIDHGEHKLALAGLARVNRFSRSTSALWHPIETAFRLNGGRPLRVLDLACGGGDVAVGIARRALEKGLAIEVEGADLSKQAVDVATETASKADVPVSFFQLDALEDEIPPRYDVIMCTLFLHHLSEADASKLLGKMAAATQQLILVDDLIRSRVGFALAWTGCRLLSRSKVVHFDGPASVGGAFQVDEIRAMADAQGLSTATIQKHWPERFLLSWRKP